MMALKKILEWRTPGGTNMWGELYYEAIFDSHRELADESTPDFIEFLRLEIYANGERLGVIENEGLNGAAVISVFDVGGLTHCLLEDKGKLKLVAFDGLTWDDLEAAWDVLSKAFNGDIWALRRERKAEKNARRPVYVKY
ncbi:MAG: hypothetical protein LBT31_06535 [Synergistaceae bacterium]|jgi:hypothetical protein|nr:hypothetical protein [Synergistaceae bacterium]